VKFTDYVTANQRTLLRFAMALTGDARLAEDVVQDSLARAFQRWDPQTELLRIAGAVQPGPALMRLPFRLSYLPVGLQANEVNLTIEPHHATAMLGLATGTRPQPGSDGNVVTIVAEANPSADFLSGCSPATSIAGHPGCADNHQASMLTDTFGVSIESTPGTYGKAELVKILSHLTLAPADPASWFDARTTLPH
jgi:hypothetical protein